MFAFEKEFAGLLKEFHKSGALFRSARAKRLVIFSLEFYNAARQYGASERGEVSDDF